MTTKEQTSYGKEITISDAILEKIKSVDFKKFPEPSKLSQPMDVGLWALWLLQDHFGLDDNHFTANEISQVLLKQKIPCSEDNITKGFTRAGEKIHKERNGQVLSYMIMQPGIEYLTRFADNHTSQDQYFTQFDGGGIHTFFLLQVDLANHTKWFGEKKVEKNNAKKELAMLFTNELRKKYEFNRLFWAGDGGVFVRTSEATPNYDVVVDAADAIYDLFEKWKKQYSELETNLLDIRVSAHISPIFADKDPGFWTSEDLNNFIKYERSISEEGFSITKQIRDLLTSSKQKRFVNSAKEIKNKDGITIMRVFLDSKHQLKN
jgi:hypothetical protein